MSIVICMFAPRLHLVEFFIPLFCTIYPEYDCSLIQY